MMVRNCLEDINSSSRPPEVKATTIITTMEVPGLETISRMMTTCSKMTTMMMKKTMSISINSKTTVAVERKETAPLGAMLAT